MTASKRKRGVVYGTLYSKHGGTQQKDMLQSGYFSIQELFADIPESIQLKEDLNIPSALSELELGRHIRSMCLNANADNMLISLAWNIRSLYPSGQPSGQQAGVLQVIRRTSQK